MARILLFIALLIISALLYSQDSPRSIQVNYTSDILRMDDIMDKAAWERADAADNFWQFFLQTLSAPFFPHH